MKKNSMLAALMGITGLLSAGTLASYVAWRNPAFADVISVEPVRQIVAAPKRACLDEQVSRHESTGSDSPSSSVVIVGMAGGAITRQPARIEKVATLSTLAARDPVGRVVQNKKNVAKNSQSNKTAADAHSQHAGDGMNTHCRKLDRASEKIVAYDVRYRLHGKTAKIRMDHDPGARLPVRNGKVVVVQDSRASKPKV